MVKETGKLKKFNKELEEIKEKVRVHNSRLNLLEEKPQQRQQIELTAQKQEKRDEEIIQQYQEQLEPIPQKKFFTSKEVATDKNLILEVHGKPAEALTIKYIWDLFQAGNSDPLCDSKKKFAIFGQLDSIAKSTINPTTNKTIPAKINLKDSTGRGFRGVVWSKTMESRLTQLLQCWIVFSEVYFKQVKDQYLSKNFHIFEIVNKLENRLERKQFEFQVNKCKIFRVKSKRAEEQ